MNPGGVSAAINDGVASSDNQVSAAARKAISLNFICLDVVSNYRVFVVDGPDV